MFPKCDCDDALGPLKEVISGYIKFILHEKLRI